MPVGTATWALKEDFPAWQPGHTFPSATPEQSSNLTKLLGARRRGNATVPGLGTVLYQATKVSILMNQVFTKTNPAEEYKLLLVLVTDPTTPPLQPLSQAVRSPISSWFFSMPLVARRKKIGPVHPL